MFNSNSFENVNMPNAEKKFEAKEGCEDAIKKIMNSVEDMPNKINEKY